MFDIVKKYAEPLNLYVGLVLLLGITYVGKLPDWFTYQANSGLGRLLLFGLTVAISELYSWIYALLMALFVVLVLVSAPRTTARKEGFQGGKGNANGNVDVKLVSQKKRWWSETILDEHPIGIEEDTVQTKAIQDNSNSSNSSTSSTGNT